VLVRSLWQAGAVLNLDDFIALVASRSHSWVEAGATWSVERSPNDGRNKHGAWVTVQQSDREGVLIVWDSGEAELEAGGSAAPFIQRHFDGIDVADAALDELVALVIRVP
jgi:hypothetical protein